MFILANMVIIALIFGDTRLIFNQIILSSVLVLQVYELIRFINKTNRELARFLTAIRQADYSVNFSEADKGNSFKELYQAFESIINTFKRVKIEKEAQYHFLLMLIEHIPVGIIALKNLDEITMVNQPAKNILGIPNLNSVKTLKAKNEQFYQELASLDFQGRKLIEINTNHEKLTLSVDISSLTMIGEEHHLVTFQDIRNEIEQKEMEAWHKLIRILTHEIMNSLTPVSSLTETMQMVLENNGKVKKANQIDDNTLADLLFSIKTIQKRSEGMLDFVEDYRKLTRVPKPDLKPVKVKHLMETVVKLMETEIDKNGVRVSVTTDQAAEEIMMDAKLIEQVLINLITNSLHALKQVKNPNIILESGSSGGKKTISVSDNGVGIDPDVVDEIFIPFFSTREGGSGIGLSLSKQIMQLHRGKIRVETKKDRGTAFILEFPK